MKANRARVACNVVVHITILAVILCMTVQRARANLGAPDLATMQAVAALPGWSAVTGWNPATNPCPDIGANWSGVTCDAGRVTTIVVVCGAQQINGPLPDILGQLTALTSLDLRNCGMTGPIPDAWSTMTRLTRLRLDPNVLTGPVPSWLPNLPSLGTLVLANNLLTGPMPAFPNTVGLDVDLAGNFLTQIPDTWTQFNRNVSYNCYPSLPATCDSQSQQNTCTPNRQECAASVMITKVSGDGQWTQEGTTFANPLVVSVTDLSSNPVAGVTVTFSGAGIVTTTAQSNSSGVASAMVQASSTVGGNTVTASTDPNTMVTFGLTAGDTAVCSSTFSVTSTNDAGPGTLRQALADVCPGGTVDLTPVAGQTIALSQSATSYNFGGRLYIGDSVSITGAGATISGSNLTRIFFVQGGNVRLSNLTLGNGLAQGGASQYGGSGAGMGGAIFQNGGTLTLNQLTLLNNQAVGGSPDSIGNGGGGGFGGNLTGGDLGGTGGTGDGAGGIVQGVGGVGGFGGGGGAGSSFTHNGGNAYGGIGGFGGGGGGGTSINGSVLINNVEGTPGYGGGFGTSPAGGGGAGFGGAIFARAGTLNLTGVTFTGNTATAGAGAQARGGSLFIYDGSLINGAIFGGAVVNIDATTTFSGSAAANAGQASVGYSGAPYSNQATCPGVDTADICGVVSNVSLAGPSSANPGTQFPVTYSSASGGTPTLSIASGPCSISGSNVTVNGASGTCVVQASWAATSVYPAATQSLTVNIASAATSCVAPPAGLTAWYKGEGDTTDVTAEYNGSVGGDLGFGAGEVGRAFSFDGTQSPYMAIPVGAFPAQPSQSPFSFEGWFKTITGGVILGEQTGVAPYAGAPNGWTPAIYVDTNGKLETEMFYTGSLTPIVSSYAVNDGAWHHVAVTFDGSTETAYLDGAAIGSQANYTQAANGSGGFYYQLGTAFAFNWPNTNGGWFTFNGLIDEATIYSTALTASQVQSIAFAGSNGKCDTSAIYSGNNQTGVTTRTLPLPFIVGANR
ncbi:MAG TPA: LamG-like jellyroll fold domain-containing protein [Bryobacteraceae bacterium]|nr:LamG-like jellyroll fold domain-containing protein [Bryobacteraceae bacterium]